MNEGNSWRALRALIVLAFATASGQAMALATISNGIYEVHIDDSNGAQLGSWNAVTGASHPTGAGNNILYEGTTTDTNFSSLRVYDPAGAVTYTPNGAGGGTNLNTYFTGSGASAFGTAANSYSQSWDVNGLQVTQDLIVTGTTYANSAIYHTVDFINNSGADISFGWRNLYDWTVNSSQGFDDGPNNAIEINGVGVVIPATTNEFSYTPAPGSFVRVSPDPTPAGGAPYEPLLGLGFDPGFIAALPVTTPELYDFVSWPSSVGTAFDYTPSGSNVTGDSAGLSWFGPTPQNALTLAAGGNLRITQTIYAVPPGGSVPGGGGTPTSVPDPATLSLLGLGLAGLGFSRRRSKARS